jgi:hypothetical protein
VRTASPKLDAAELAAVDAHRSALRHWAAAKLNLARLEREPGLPQTMSTARSVEIRAAERTRETRRALDAALLEDG